MQTKQTRSNHFVRYLANNHLRQTNIHYRVQSNMQGFSPLNTQQLRKRV
jgi:hypothetical protein